MKAQEIADFVFEIAPNPSWGTENIFEFGDGGRDVSGIGVAWWITSDILQSMIDRGLDLGLTHERTIYDLVTEYRWGKIIRTDEVPANQKIARLATDNRIAIHRFHSNIDICDWGMPHALLEQLAWNQNEVDWTRGIPVVTIQPMKLADLIRRVKEKLHLPIVRYDGDLKRIIQRIAIPWGGMCFGWNGAACVIPIGFDCILGGDITDGVVRFAREHRWCVIDAQHHITEREAMQRLAQRVRDRFPQIPIQFFENSLPWAVA